MPYLKFKKIILFYLSSYLIFASGLFFLIKYRKDTQFSKERLELMLTTPSIYKGVVTDPCQYFLKGEPLDLPTQYVKMHLYCTPTYRSSNTLGLPALKDRTLMGLIKELGRIQGFAVAIDKNELLALGSLQGMGERRWRCLDTGEKELKFLELDYQLRPKDNLACFFLTSGEIKELLIK